MYEQIPSIQLYSILLCHLLVKFYLKYKNKILSKSKIKPSQCNLMSKYAGFQ